MSFGFFVPVIQSGAFFAERRISRVPKRFLLRRNDIWKMFVIQRGAFAERRISCAMKRFLLRRNDNANPLLSVASAE